MKNERRASRDFIMDNYESEKTRRDAAMVKKITFLNKSVLINSIFGLFITTCRFKFVSAKQH